MIKLVLALGRLGQKGQEKTLVCRGMAGAGARERE